MIFSSWLPNGYLAYSGLLVTLIIIITISHCFGSVEAFGCQCDCGSPKTVMDTTKHESQPVAMTQSTNNVPTGDIGFIYEFPNYLGHADRFKKGQSGSSFAGIGSVYVPNNVILTLTNSSGEETHIGGNITRASYMPNMPDNFSRSSCNYVAT